MHLPQHRQTWLEPGLPVTSLIVLANLLAFAAMIVFAGSAARIDMETLIKFGANDRAIGDQSWRLWTSVFLHVDAIALLTNMWLLVWTAQLVERKTGPHLFLALYLVCAAAASSTSTMWNPAAVSVGALGALCGVWGVLLAFTMFEQTLRADRRWRFVATFVVFSTVIDLSTMAARPHVDTPAHCGGLLAGLMLGAMFLLISKNIQRFPNLTCLKLPVTAAGVS